MATVHPHVLFPAAPGRRPEILELYASLAGSSHAQILGVPPGASPTTVREAFVARARRLHPDTLAPGDADLRDQLQAIFIRLNDAYRSLGSDHPAARAAKRSPDPPRETAPMVAPRPTPLVAPPPPSDPEERRARVEEALRSAEASIARREIAEAVSVLHAVHSQADDGQRRRIRLVLARAYVGDPRWRRYGLGLLSEMLRRDTGRCGRSRHAGRAVPARGAAGPRGGDTSSGARGRPRASGSRTTPARRARGTGGRADARPEGSARAARPRGPPALDRTAVSRRRPCS